MTQSANSKDLLDFDVDKKKLPEMLNVLTILTFVGCGLGVISSLWAFTKARSSYEQMLEMQNKFDELPELAKKFLGPDAVEVARKSLENRLPILLLSFVAYGLCLYGAIQMRARKKVGFSIYTIGELLPVVTGFIFVGAGAFGIMGIVGYFLFPAVFIILYATQSKHLA